MKDRSVLLVGAFERDNFGDILLLLVSEKYFERECLLIGAPFPGDMRSVFGRMVPAFGPILESRMLDLVWTVGGGVGTIGFGQAMGMSLSALDRRRYDGMSESERQAFVRELCGVVRPDSPYMPRLSAYARNFDTPCALNSVGLAGLHKQSFDRMTSLVQVVSEAGHVGVREAQSKRVLDQLGIACRCSPDIVHAMPLHWPSNGERSDEVLLQASEAFLDRESVDRFATVVAESEALRGRPLRLFLAGVAPGHDSRDQYAAIRDRVRKYRRDVDIEIIDERNPIALARRIASAALWVGTSLHGRVLAMAYGVPRVSFDSFKLRVYSDTWDPYGAAGVSLTDLDDAVAYALAEVERDRAVDYGLWLANVADRSMRATVARALGESRGEALARRVRAIEGFRKAMLGKH